MSPALLRRRLRAALLFFIGALAMHWLCYLPTRSSSSQQVHDFLAAATPIAVGIAVAGLLVSLLIPVAAVPTPRTVTLEARAARYALGLVIVFFVQELAEYLFVATAGAQADAVLGVAAWFVLPLAFALGGLTALFSSALERAERRIAGAIADRTPLSPSPSLALVVGGLAPALATRNLAFGFARRPPPRTS